MDEKQIQRKERDKNKREINASLNQREYTIKVTLDIDTYNNYKALCKARYRQTISNHVSNFIDDFVVSELKKIEKQKQINQQNEVIQDEEL